MNLALTLAFLAGCQETQDVEHTPDVEVVAAYTSHALGNNLQAKIGDEVYEVRDMGHRRMDDLMIDQVGTTSNNPEPVTGYGWNSMRGVDDEGLRAVLRRTFQEELAAGSFVDIRGIAPTEELPAEAYGGEEQISVWNIKMAGPMDKDHISYDWTQRTKLIVGLDPKTPVTLVDNCPEACLFQAYDQTTGRYVMFFPTDEGYSGTEEAVRDAVGEVIRSLSTLDLSAPLVVHGAIIEVSGVKPEGYEVERTVGDKPYLMYEFRN